MFRCLGLWIASLVFFAESSSAQIGYVQSGEASYYADVFEGRKTASGEPYARAALTAAHRELPFGAIVRVTNTASQQTCTVCINDRGPFKEGRVIDLSYAAAEQIGLVTTGTAPVRLEVIGLAEGGSCAQWQETRRTAETFARKFPPKKTEATPPPSSSGSASVSSAKASGKFASPGTYDLTGKPQKLAGQWGVQVGSFRSLANAQQAAERVKKVGFSKVYLQLSGTGEVDHRVIVGAHKQKTAAQKAATQLRKKAFAPTVVQHR